MDNKHISILSTKSARLELFTGETDAKLGEATGFFCHYKNQDFLVTNWHVATGRRTDTEKPIHPSLGLPAYIRCDLNGSFTLKMDIPLFHNEIPRWIEHPIYSRLVDVVAIPLGNRLSNAGLNDASYDIEHEMSKIERLHVMDTVTIIGYPLTRSQSNNQFPIFKDGTIASEPEIYDEEPRFFVDSKTKNGMSGSPVIVTQTKPPSFIGTKLTMPQDIRTLIGIYSGRDGNAKDEHEAELGRVWPIKECLIPILESAEFFTKHN